MLGEAGVGADAGRAIGLPGRPGQAPSIAQAICALQRNTRAKWHRYARDVNASTDRIMAAEPAFTNAKENGRKAAVLLGVRPGGRNRYYLAAP